MEVILSPLILFAAIDWQKSGNLEKGSSIARPTNTATRWQRHLLERAKVNRIYFLLSKGILRLTDIGIPHICHGRHGRRPCKCFCLVQMFTDLTRKIGNLLSKLAIYCVNFSVNFILQKFCLCKKNDKYKVWREWVARSSWKHGVLGKKSRRTVDRRLPPCRAVSPPTGVTAATVVASAPSCLSFPS